MRRPTPIPPPAERSTGNGDRSPTPERRAADEITTDEIAIIPDSDADDAVALVGAVDPVDSAEPVASVAAVIPLTTPMQRPAELPATTIAEDEPDVAPDAPVRLREVWAAARARRKALRAEVRRFTGRQRRRRALWLGGAASVVLLVLATLGAAYSPLFAVEQIRIVGADQLDTAAVEAALSDQVGTPLPLVDESAVKAALVAFPLVESYSLEARPPHELVVRIVERTPIGLIQTRAGFTLVDAAGVALSTSQTPAAGTPILTVEGGTASPAFAAVGQVMRSVPEPIRVQVTAVSASTPDDVTLTLGGSNAQVVWGSADESALKAVVLEKAMAARLPADVFAYDVSSPGSVVFR